MVELGIQDNNRSFGSEGEIAMWKWWRRTFSELCWKLFFFGITFKAHFTIIFIYEVTMWLIFNFVARQLHCQVQFFAPSSIWWNDGHRPDWRTSYGHQAWRGFQRKRRGYEAEQILFTIKYGNTKLKRVAFWSFWFFVARVGDLKR